MPKLIYKVKMSELEIVSFSNKISGDRKLLKKFVQFHWDLYKDEKRFFPLLDYEYLGSKVFGIAGYFNPDNLFFQHGEVHFFSAIRDKKMVGRVCSYVNRAHNSRWQDQVGFIGHFECINDTEVARALLESAEKWLQEKGMKSARGPQNFPVNEAAPGIMVEGFDSRKVIYCHFNFPYYKHLLEECGYRRLIDVFTYDISVTENSIHKSLDAISRRVITRNNVTMEYWSERPVSVRRQEMMEIYNNAWKDNFGFVPYTEEEFTFVVRDMQLIMDKKLFLVLYVDGKAAGFFGGVPNIADEMDPLVYTSSLEFLRTVKMFCLKSRIKGFRLGFLGVKTEFQKLGLEAVILWKQSALSKALGYRYCNMGWVLETNALMVRLIERVGATQDKRYSTYEKDLG